MALGSENCFRSPAAQHYYAAPDCIAKPPHKYILVVHNLDERLHLFAGIQDQTGLWQTIAGPARGEPS